jgi:hypothetical protein
MVTGFDGAVGTYSDLSALVGLEYLHILNCANIGGDLRDLEPLTNLKYLSLEYRAEDTQNLSGNLDSLKNMTKLHGLVLSADASIGSLKGNVSALSNMKDLEKLILFNAQHVKGDVSSISNLTKLKTVEFAACQGIGGDIGVFSNFQDLENLDLTYTKVSGDIDVLAVCLNLRNADFKGSANLSGNALSLEHLNSLSISDREIEGTKITRDETPLPEETMVLFNVWKSGDVEVEFKEPTGKNDLGQSQGEFVSESCGNGTYTIGHAGMVTVEFASDKDNSLLFMFDAENELLAGFIGEDYLILNIK